MKTAVIAGGNSGVGKATAVALAKKGFRVIIHGRDANKTKQAAEDIKSKSGNTNIDSIVVDVSTLKGMKELADAIKQMTDCIDALVLSTGVILPKQIITADGLEMGFAIQYLARFALVQLLMPELKKSGAARIVMMAAPTLKTADIYFDDIALRNSFTMMKAMGQEMLANHLFTQEFAKRHTDKDIVMNILHVGIAKTDIMRETNFFLRLMVNLFGTTPEKASANPVYLATDDSANFSGYFLSKPGKPEEKEKLQWDEARNAKLWDKSMELIKDIL